MGRAPCCDKANVKKGPWSPEEDAKLKEYIDKYGTGGNWIALPQKVGLRRCGKSCRLRWLNYLRPNIKHGEFSDEEDRIIINLFANIGSRWSIIAAQLPGRTDNDIKNYWNTKLKKKLMGMINQPSGQRKAHPLLFQTSSSSSFSSSPTPPPSSSYGSHYSQAAAAGGPFTNSTTFEPMSAFSTIGLSSSSSTTGSGSFLQPQVTQGQGYLSGGLLMFGGDQASCSSSDGSCNNNNNQMLNQNGVISDGNFVNNGNWGISDQASSFLEYGLEEIKQLISSTITSSSNNSLFDENYKTHGESVLYYNY